MLAAIPAEAKAVCKFACCRGYAMLLDSARFGYGEDDSGLHLEAFFLGADNGYELGLMAFPSLSDNPNLSGVKGPVVVVGVGYLEMMPYTDEACLCVDVPGTEAVSKEDLLIAIKDRYRDAGLAC